MQGFPINTLDNAPEKSASALRSLQSAFGFLPNIAGAMSTSPVLIDSLVGLFGNVHGGSFSELQIQVVLLTNAVTNRATWAVAFHSFLAEQAGVSAQDIEAIRSGRAPQDATLGALSTLAKTLIEKRGRISDDDGERFLAQDFGRDHMLEVIAIVAASTITNYTANVIEPALEAKFAPYTWVAPNS